MPVTTLSIAGTLTLATTDVGLFVLTPTGSDQTVVLPPPTAAGDTLGFINGTVGSGHNVVVMDVSSTMTLATLTPGQFFGPQMAILGGSFSIPRSRFPPRKRGSTASRRR